MNWHVRSCPSLVVFGLILVCAFAGCRQDAVSPLDRYIPTAEAARAGVTLAMDGWIKGLSPGESGSKRPEIRIVDQTRRADQRLGSYEILGEVPVDLARAFAVRVRYEGAEETEIVRFLAVGVDPMWIFRQEDYDSLMMHQSEVPADRVGEPARKP